MKVRAVTTRMDVENWKFQRKIGDIPARSTPVKLLFIGNKSLRTTTTCRERSSPFPKRGTTNRN